MNTIRATIVDGHIHVPVSADLPDGTEVEVQITPLASAVKPGDGQWDDSPAGVEAWIKQYENLEPLVLTDSERAEMATALQDQKDWEKNQFTDHADKQRMQWE
jgi:hypothetical protein